MRRRMILGLVVLAVGCRGAGDARTERAPEASAAPSSPDAGVTTDAAAREAGGGDAGASSPAPAARPLPARPLPARARLLAPFQGAARGFVAITDTSAVPSGSRRLVVSLRGADPVDLERPVPIASFTKLWTAVAALRMVERGEITLEATIAEVLPELASRPWSRSTLRELLGHVSQVPELDEGGEPSYFRRRDVDFTNPASVLARHVPRGWAEKRGVYKYRNSEAAMVGAMLSRRASLPAPELLAREVFGPAGLRHSGLLVGAAPADLDLTPLGGVRPHNFFTAGAGYSSPADLLAFLEALAGAALLGEASKRALFEGHGSEGHALGCWSYSLRVGDGGAARVVERPGALGDVRLFTALFPDHARAIVAFSPDAPEIHRPHPASGIGRALLGVALE